MATALAVLRRFARTGHVHTARCSTCGPITSGTRAGLLVLADAHASLGLAHRVTVPDRRTTP